MSRLDTVHPSLVWMLNPLLKIRGGMIRRALHRAIASKGLSRGRSGTGPDPIHIAYLANAPVPTKAANCVHVMKMCNAFQSIGYRTTLLAERSGRDSVDEARLFDDFGVSPFDVCLLDRSRGALAMEAERIDEALQRGATHFFGRSLFGSYAAALTGAPSLLERHLPLKPSEVAIATDLFSRPSFLGLIVISDALKRWYERRFANLAGRITVLPDAADPPLAEARDFAFEAVRDTSFRAGYAGHLYPGKGAEIIAALARRMPHVSFHVLGGDDADIARWRNETADLRNIVFYGFRPQREVSAFLRGPDVMLTPYQREVRVQGGGEVSAWMSPLKIFECMAHAKPIISSDLPVLREVLTDNVNALLCDPDNIDSWVAAIERLRRDRSLAASIARKAKAEFQARYSWLKRADRIVETLSQGRMAENKGSTREDELLGQRR